MADSTSAAAQGVSEQLKAIYNERFRPVEAATGFGNSYTNGELSDSWFDSPPMVLLIGPYSVGKTTFIRHLLGNRDFPGSRIGPEPTTDGFSAIMYGSEERLIPGNALTIAPGSPFGGLTYFGNKLLTRFQGAYVDSELLRHVKHQLQPSRRGHGARCIPRGSTVSTSTK